MVVKDYRMVGDGIGLPTSWIEQDIVRSVHFITPPVFAKSHRRSSKAGGCRMVVVRVRVLSNSKSELGEGEVRWWWRHGEKPKTLRGIVGIKVC